MYSCDKLVGGGGATELSQTFIGLELKRGEQQLWSPASVLALFKFFKKNY